VTLTIGSPVATSIVVTPSTASVPFRQQLQLSASVLDQQGAPLSPQPAITWSLAGTGATLSAAGLFVAGSTAATYSAIATSGSLRDTAVITVYRAITITYPTGGETFVVNQVVTIRWTATDNVIGAVIQVSPTGDEPWYDITTGYVTRSDAQWGAYSWTVPATVGSGVPLTTNQCRIRIYSYTESAIDDVTPTPFSVPVRPSVGAVARRSAQVRDLGGRLLVAAPWEGLCRVTLAGPDGRVLRRAEFHGGAAQYLALGAVRGCVVVRVESVRTGERVERRLIVAR
jgi:hypothetical protein